MQRNELENKILEAQKAYYDGNPIMEDSEFDELWDQLQTEYPDSDILYSVGKDTIKNNKVKHLMLMGSQNKFNTEEGLEAWIKSENIEFPLLVEWKLDGISVELQYVNGKLYKAVTRGDGYYGEDITRAVSKMNGVPEKFTDPWYFHFTGAIRGEILIKKELFEKKYAGEFKNPRNFVAGAVKNEAFTAYSDFDVVTYDVWTSVNKFTNEVAKWNFLNDHKFIVAPGFVVYNKRELMNKRNQFNPKSTNWAIDGLVLKQEKIDLNDETELRPKKQRAFKWQDEGEETILKDVQWSQNGTTFTPVALLDPVEIEGSVVSRASLANMAEIRDLGIKIGDKVLVTKRGMIIPKIEKVVETYPESEKIIPPSICPICHSKLVWEDTKVYCNNSECKGNDIHRISKWISTLDCKGFGPALQEYVCYNCGTYNISDLYKNHVREYVCKTYGSINAEKAFNDLYSKSQNISLTKFVAGFDIDGIGIEMVQSLVDAGFDSFEKLVNISYEDLLKISGWSDTRASIFEKGLEANKNEMQALLESGLVTLYCEEEKSPVKECELSGKKVCVTGKLNNFSRKEVEEFMKEHGIIAVDSVNKTTDYLVTNDPNSGSSKNKNAQKFGIMIISEKEFINMVG